MLTTKQILVFNKEANNRWYVQSRKWKADHERLFREIATYTDEDGKVKHYANDRDMNDPKDDHTKHPDWPEFKKETHETLAMNESVTELLDQIAGGKRRVGIDVRLYLLFWLSFTYIWRPEKVSNTK